MGIYWFPFCHKFLQDFAKKCLQATERWLLFNHGQRDMKTNLRPVKTDQI
jgi:hypothetical protein